MKLLFSLFISFFLLSCELEFVDKDKGKVFNTDSLQQDMVSNGDIIYLLSKDKIRTININNSLLPGKTNIISFKTRVDFKSIKKISDYVYVLDENKKIYVYSINSNDNLVSVKIITLNHEANSFEVFDDNSILIASYDNKSDLFDISDANTTVEENTFLFNEIKEEVRLSYLNKTNSKLYAISNLNKFNIYDLSNIKKINKYKSITVDEKIHIITSNEQYIFLASDENIFVYDLELNKISSFKLDRITSLLFSNNYLYVSRGLNGIDKLDISDIENIKKVAKYDKNKDKNNKKILFNKDKNKIIIMRNSDVTIININSFVDI